MNEEEIKQMLHSQAEKMPSHNFNDGVLEKLSKLRKAKSLTSQRDIALLVSFLAVAVLWSIFAPWHGATARQTLLVFVVLLLLPLLLIVVYAIQQQTNTNI
jgi:Flp pilus assembly protein TadB